MSKNAAGLHDRFAARHSACHHRRAILRPVDQSFKVMEMIDMAGMDITSL
jgi:hypothetical protein